MSAHLNIDASTFAATYGITLGTGAEAESATATTTVAINELLDSATAAINAVAPIHHAERRTQVDGAGPASLTLTAATIATPATLTVISSEVTEAPNTRCRFSIQAHGDLDFADSAGVQSSVGAEPTISDLEITSVAYSIAESVRRSVTIENKVLVGSDGTPAARATCTVRKPFSISGRGDLPAGTALGTDNVLFAGSATGVTVAGTLRTGERTAEFNLWGVDGTNYPAAA
jgi:hypothetical protein